MSDVGLQIWFLILSKKRWKKKEIKFLFLIIYPWVTLTSYPFFSIMLNSNYLWQYDEMTEILEKNF